MDEQMLESWDIHNRMLFMLFDAIEPEGFQGRPTGMTGRSIGNIFAHLHNIRRGWVENAAPALLDDVEKIPTRKKGRQRSAHQRPASSGIGTLGAGRSRVGGAEH